LHQEPDRTILSRVLRHDAGKPAKFSHDPGQCLSQLLGQEVLDVAAPAVLRQGLDPQAQYAPLVTGLGARCAQAFAKEIDGAHFASLQDPCCTAFLFLMERGPGARPE
jgi:hypothetical protein